MLNTLTNLRKREDGFTLIELMIVMVVLGILAGIVLFGIGTFKTDATTSATTANNRMCDTAKAAWSVNNDTTPTADNLKIYFHNNTVPAGCP